MTFSENKAHDLRDSYRGPDLRLFVRDVREQKKRPIMVKTWSTIQDVKNLLQHLLHVPPSAQRLFFGPTSELPNHRTLMDAGIYQSGQTLLLEIGGEHGSGLAAPSSAAGSTLANSTNDVCVASSLAGVTPRGLRQRIQQARRGMALGLKPELVLDGSGGTYFLFDARKRPVGVFKPSDEEPYAANNPRGYVRVSPKDTDLTLRPGIEPGELCLREVAAYLLDHGGFSGVPMTTLAEARHPAFHASGARWNCSQGGAAIGHHSLDHCAGTRTTESTVSSLPPKKIGSLQEFVKSECTMDDMGTSQVCADEIHKIAILDIRIMNADRNAANLLCRRRPRDGSIELIPIDHGFCLRTKCDVSWYDWCWLDWPQMKEPLSNRSRNYVLKLDIEEDARMLKERFNLSQEALDCFRASSKLLQEGVKAGLTLYEIATMCCRNDSMGEHPSKLEILTSMAKELATSALENGRWHHAAASKALAEQLSPTSSSSSKSLTMSLLSLGGEAESSSSLNRMIKSASSANFASHTSATVAEKGIGSGDMADDVLPKLMGSDTGSEDDDQREEELEDEGAVVDQWAAAVLMDVSIDKSMTMLKAVQAKRRRDSSIGSSDEDGSASILSTSPKGFWQTSPGQLLSDSSDSEDDKEEEIVWSPVTSPGLLMGESVTRQISFAVPVPVFGDDKKGSSVATAITTPTASDRDTKSNNELYQLPPSTVDVAKFKRSSSSSISRSRSYSALSSHLRDNGPPSSLLDRRASGVVGGDIWRSYVVKYVDLVIRRETQAAAARNCSNAKAH